MDSLFFNARAYFNSRAGVKVYTVLGHVPPQPERAEGEWEGNGLLAPAARLSWAGPARIS